MQEPAHLCKQRNFSNRNIPQRMYADVILRRGRSESQVTIMTFVLLDPLLEVQGRIIRSLVIWKCRFFSQASATRRFALYHDVISIAGLPPHDCPHPHPPTPTIIGCNTNVSTDSATPRFPAPTSALPPFRCEHTAFIVGDLLVARFAFTSRASKTMIKTTALEFR